MTLFNRRVPERMTVKRTMSIPRVVYGEIEIGLYRVQPDGSIRVTRGDTYRRQVQIVIPLRLIDGDTRTLFVRSSHQATIAGRYANLVKKILEKKADPATLKQFEGVKVGGHELLTDVAALRRVADAGLIRIDQFGSGQELGGGEQ